MIRIAKDFNTVKFDKAISFKNDATILQFVNHHTKPDLVKTTSSNTIVIAIIIGMHLLNFLNLKYWFDFKG